MKKIGRKINIIEENVCELPCKCGWNLQIGGKDPNDLKRIKKVLRTMYNPKVGILINK